MPSALSTAMHDEMKGLGRVHPVLELELDGTTYRFAKDHAVISASAGLYKSQVVSWGSWGRHAGYSSFSIDTPEFEVEIFDEDRSLQKAIGGPARDAVRDNPVSRWWRSFHVAAADQYKIFSGVIRDYSQRDRNYRFRMGPDARMLESNPKIPFFTKQEFPTAPESSIGQPLWIVVGVFASGAVPDATGMVKCLPVAVDANGKSTEWVVSYGQGVISAIYKNGVKEAISDWGFGLLQRGTHYYQMGYYTGAGTKPLPTDTVTVDMSGLRVESPFVSGGGNTITNPAEAMRRILGHFGYGNGDMRPGVAWTSETGIPIATAVWGECQDYFGDREERMARVIKADQKLGDIFSEWCDDFGAVPFWADGWKIGAIPEDESEINVYRDDLHIVQRFGHALSELQGAPARTQPVQSIQVNYLLNEATGSFAKSGLVHDPRAIGRVRETFDFENGTGEIE